MLMIMSRGAGSGGQDSVPLRVHDIEDGCVLKVRCTGAAAVLGSMAVFNAAACSRASPPPAAQAAAATPCTYL